MTQTSSRHYAISWNMGIEKIPKEAWDALAEALDTPLLDWEWLRVMEASNSITAETGWLPCHLTVRSGTDLVAAAPLYVKGHSEGEFVYDYAWADVASQFGINYYPKLIGMSPATPAVGYRFLIAPGEDEEVLTGIMIEAIDNFCTANNLSGSSFHFVDPAWRGQVEQHGYSCWMHQSYEWVNQGFESFDGYLQSFTKNQRRNIRRERQSVANQGITIKAITGEEIPESYLPAMYRYYERTNDQFGPWAAKYLTKEFFTGLYPRFCHRLLLIAAYEDENELDPVALSFLLTKGDTIIGRYWGTERMYDSLHFDACYYSPIEWAISNGIKHFDPGAGSPHKLRRGFFAVPNYSLHRFADEKLRSVMETYIDEINLNERKRIDAMNGTLPLKKEYLPAFTERKQ